MPFKKVPSKADLELAEKTQAQPASETCLEQPVVLGSPLIPSGSGSFPLFLSIVHIIYTAAPLTFSFYIFIYLFLGLFFLFCLILTFSL